MASEFDDENLKAIMSSGLLATPDGKSAEDVVTDYLAELYRHIMEELITGDKKSLLDVTPIKFWFTFPAVWSTKAQEATKRAACAAGFASRAGDEFYMVREPEAAAIACLNQFVKDGRSSLVKGGRYLYLHGLP